MVTLMSPWLPPFRPHLYGEPNFIREEQAWPLDTGHVPNEPVAYVDLGTNDIPDKLRWLIQHPQFAQDIQGLMLMPNSAEQDESVSLLVEHANVVCPQLEYLALSLSQQLDLTTLLDALPDLAYLYLSELRADLRPMRHASLRWLEVDEIYHLAGLELCSFPCLQGLAFDKVNAEFFNLLPTLGLNQLMHLGCLRAAKDVVGDDLLRDVAWPTTVRSLTLVGGHMGFTPDVLNHLPQQLSHLHLESFAVPKPEQMNLPDLKHLSFCQFSDEGYEAEELMLMLREAPHLQQLAGLDLRFNHFTAEEVVTLIETSVPAKVSYLNLDGHVVDDGDVLQRVVRWADDKGITLQLRHYDDLVGP